MSKRSLALVCALAVIGYLAAPIWHLGEGDFATDPMALAQAAEQPELGAKVPAIPQIAAPVESAKFQKIVDSIPGGPIQPCLELADPYPEFNSIAIDPKGGIAVLSDTNLKSALVYPLEVKADPAQRMPTPYSAWIKGPATWLSFATGVGIDPVRHEFYIAENDYGDDVARFPYAASGNYPAQVLAIPHGAYGLAVSQKYRQLAMSIEHTPQIIFYRLDATRIDPPLRSIRGRRTRLADPHGIFWDEKNGEIYTVNHGNWNRGDWDPDYNGGGRYYPPSITVYPDDAKGDVAPRRMIQGGLTQLNWPSAIAVDNRHGEIFVANTVSNNVLVFARAATGNVAPIRVLGGARSLIDHPMGVAYDPAHDELWVANFGHTAEIFGRAAGGDAAPRRVIRNAPAGAGHTDFGNPMALAYDSRRDEILVPN